MDNASWLWMGIVAGTTDYTASQVWADADARWGVFSPGLRRRIRTCLEGLQLLRPNPPILLAGLADGSAVLKYSVRG